MSYARGSVPVNPAAVVEHLDATIEERDRLEEFSNQVAGRMGDSFDGEETQEWLILRWLDLVEERMKDKDPAGHAWLFLGRADPREDEEEATDDVKRAAVGWEAKP